MLYYANLGFPDLSHWTLSTRMSADLLINIATVALIWNLLATIALIWSLLRAKKPGWLTGTSLFFLNMGGFSLIVVFNQMAYSAEYSLFSLSSLSQWAYSIGICAGFLIGIATFALIWNLLHARKRGWLAGLSLLLLGVSCWLLVVAFNTASYSYEFDPLNNFRLYDLYSGAFSAEISAVLLMVMAIVALIWSVLHAKKLWWLAGMSLLSLGIGGWSLLVALNGFQQLVAFWDRFSQVTAHGGHGPTPYEIRLILSTYDADVQRCQIQFWLTGAMFVLLAIVGLWQLIADVRHRDAEGQGKRY